MTGNEESINLIVENKSDDSCAAVPSPILPPTAK